MPPDPESYRRSNIDWQRLTAYARRVACETSKPKQTKVVTEQGQRPTTKYKKRLLRSPLPYTVMEPYTETKRVSTDYWVLEERYRKETTVRPRDVMIETTYTEYCLASDGTMFTHSWEELTFRGSGDPHIYDHSGQRSFSDEDVMWFDCWHDVSPYRDGNVTIEAKHSVLHLLRLRHHKKGVGLSKALGELLK